MLEPGPSGWLLHGFGAMFGLDSIHKLPLIISVVHIACCDLNNKSDIMSSLLTFLFLLVKFFI